MLDKAIAPLQGRSVKGFECKARYDSFIGGKLVAPVSGRYFDNVSPITGQVDTQAARSNEADTRSRVFTDDEVSALQHA